MASLPALAGGAWTLAPILRGGQPVEEAPTQAVMVEPFTLTATALLATVRLPLFLAGAGYQRRIRGRWGVAADAFVLFSAIEGDRLGGAALFAGPRIWFHGEGVRGGWFQPTAFALVGAAEGEDLLVTGGGGGEVGWTWARLDGVAASVSLGLFVPMDRRVSTQLPLFPVSRFGVGWGW